VLGTPSNKGFEPIVDGVAREQLQTFLHGGKREVVPPDGEVSLGKTVMGI
jgi:hypothetical protein